MVSRLAFLGLFFFACCVLNAAPAAAQCPGNLNTNSAQVTRNGTALFGFIGSVEGCTAMAVGGAVSQCQFNWVNDPGEGQYDGFLQAVWPNGAAKAGDESGGCQFNCTGGSCFMGNNGLPVELLQFGVE